MLRKEVARLIGVKEESIYNWENNRSSPRLGLIPRVVEFLGYVPFDTSGRSLRERLVALRRLCGISQEELAHRLDVAPTTLRRWERGKGKPMEMDLEKVNALLSSPQFDTSRDEVEVGQVERVPGRRNPS